VFLNVTSLRAINNTAVKNATAHGDLNDTQLDEYNIECQGHTTRMGKKAYNFAREIDRAKTLQNINDMINKKYQERVYSDSDSDSDSDESGEEELDGDDVQLSRKKRKRDENIGSIEDKVISKIIKVNDCDKQLISNHSDWGKKHPFYEVDSRKIKWSPFEKDYIQAIYDNKHLSQHNVWKQCLDSILNTNDENVRQQFHISHLTLVKLKDAIRVRNVRKEGRK
jgi:hypothetical protein